MFLASYYILDSLLASITKSITSKFQRLFSQSAVPHYSNKLGSFRYSYLIPNPILLFHFIFPLERYLFHVFWYFLFIHYSFLISILYLHSSIQPVSTVFYLIILIYFTGLNIIFIVSTVENNLTLFSLEIPVLWTRKTSLVTNDITN